MQIIEYKILRLSSFCWGTFALVDPGTSDDDRAVYSISSHEWPTREQVSQILTSGRRLPSVVAAHYFPEAVAAAVLPLATDHPVNIAA